MRSADKVVEEILSQILKSSQSIANDSRAVLLVNNLGSTTLMELNIIARAALLFLGD
jgi:dihydroxyacetone kinase